MVAEDEATRWVSRQSGKTEGHNSNALIGESLADGLILERVSLQPTAPEASQPEISKPMFVLPHWHKAYGEALLSTDSLESPVLISWAEMEIQARYLTEFACPIEPEESLDLTHAMEVLSQFKKASTTVLRYGIAGRGD
jgi:hypothetical protein